MAQVVESLPPKSETQIELLAPGFCLAWSQQLLVFGECQWMGNISVSLSLCLCLSNKLNT